MRTPKQLKKTQRTRSFLFPILILISTILSACVGIENLFQPTPLPMPQELNATPLPADSTPGGLEDVFISRVSEAGQQPERCYTLYRFYPDGLALYSKFSCFKNPPSAEDLSTVQDWLNRENPRLWRGDYSLQQNRIFIRITVHDVVHEITSLRYFQGSICEGQMVLQEPAVTTYAGLPSALNQPVLEYTALKNLSIQPSEIPPANRKNRSQTTCVPPSFMIIRRPYITLINGQSLLEIQTNPQEVCTLTYLNPAGETLLSAADGTIRADGQGLCRWLFEIGNVRGTGTLTLQIGEITQSLSIDIR